MPNRMCYIGKASRPCEFFDDSTVSSVSQMFFHKLRTDRDARPNEFSRDSWDADSERIAYRKRCTWTVSHRYERVRDFSNKPL